MSAANNTALRTLIERVRTAIADATPLCIRGGGTKDFYGGPRVGEVVDTRALSGIVDYQPSELFITALAGTPLCEVAAALAERNQYLAFEPPSFSAGGTIGGMVAAGLSGPARVSAGSLRDFVLGSTLINGRAELLNFGGQVMKNVAGYDVSRTLAGSLGIFGIITSVTLKAMPLPVSEVTLAFEFDEPTALRQLNSWAGQPLPLNASLWTDTNGMGMLHLRLRGAAAAVEATVRQLGGDRVDQHSALMLWKNLRDHSDRWFVNNPDNYDLWRVSVPQTASALPLSGRHMVEWHGGLRWYWLPRDQEEPVRAAARSAGGHATLFRSAATMVEHDAGKQSRVFTRPAPALLAVHRQLKRAFDPHTIFNRGRLYAEL